MIPTAHALIPRTVVPVAPRCCREVGHLYLAQVREQLGRDEDDREDVDGETKGP